MKIKVKKSCIVLPAGSTPSDIIPMSEFDHTGVLTDVQVIYFYSRPSEHWLTPDDRIFKTVQDALSRALVHYYPLAGRLRPLEGARLELHCNNKGVELIQAESEVKLEDLGDLMASPPYLHYLIPQVDYVALPIEEIPLLTVQLTKFGCSGVSLSFTTSHVAADGQSALHFLTGLAALARGEEFSAMPCFDTKLLRAGEPGTRLPRFRHPEFEPPPVLIGKSDGEVEKWKGTTDELLKLSRVQVEELKNEANKARPGARGHIMCRPYTRYEAITAHIWRSACKARRHVPQQPTAMGITVDIRRRIQPPLPRTYFFNGVLQVIAEGQSGEIMTEPLGHVAEKIRVAIERVTDEYVHSAIDHLKGLKDLSYFQDLADIKTGEGPFYGNPCLGVISWIGFPLQGLDFGWGKEVFMAPRTHDCDGDVLILPSCEGDGSLIVALCLQAECMEDFKKFFYLDIPSN